jgi:hypothetical protein
MKKAFILAILTILGCKSESIDANADSLGESLSIKFKQQSQVGSLSLLFDNVADSRCPVNAQCFRAGEVVIDLQLNSTQKVQMCLGDCQLVQPARKKGFVRQDSLDVTVDSQKYLLILQQVNPFPSGGNVIKENYEIKMHVVKR